MTLFNQGDRTIHARCDGFEVVRYDRAGKWYIEPTNPMMKRRQVTIGQAVRAALDAKEQGGSVYLNKSGGSAFDAKVSGRAPY